MKIHLSRKTCGVLATLLTLSIAMIGVGLSKRGRGDFVVAESQSPAPAPHDISGKTASLETINTKAPAQSGSRTEPKPNWDPKTEEEFPVEVQRLNKEATDAGFSVETGSRTHDEMSVLKGVLKGYHRIFGEYPRGDSNDIFAAIAGENSRNLTVIELPRPFLDRWGVAYQITPHATKLFEIRSAGPDRLFWTEDDIARGLKR